MLDYQRVVHENLPMSTTWYTYGMVYIAGLHVGGWFVAVSLAACFSLLRLHLDLRRVDKQLEHIVPYYVT